jgi:hypothetical protein
MSIFSIRQAYCTHLSLDEDGLRPHCRRHLFVDAHEYASPCLGEAWRRTLEHVETSMQTHVASLTLQEINVRILEAKAGKFGTKSRSCV